MVSYDLLLPSVLMQFHTHSSGSSTCHFRIYLVLVSRLQGKAWCEYGHGSDGMFYRRLKSSVRANTVQYTGARELQVDICHVSGASVPRRDIR